MLKECKMCGEKIKGKGNSAKFCDINCRKKYKDIEKSKRIFVCEWCGAEFSNHRKTKYCSEICRLSSYGRASVKQSEPQISKPNYDLTQITILAKKAGLTYGQYVAKYQI